MFGRKAQMSAPFELLVAVIIMGFVLFFGMTALNQLAKEQCSKDLDKTMHDLVNAVELVTNQGAVQSVTIRIPSCYSKPQGFSRRGQPAFSRPRLYFLTMQSESACSTYCRSYRKNCYLLAFESAEESKLLCINISIFTSFPPNDSCPQMDGYSVPSNLTNEIPEGYYVLHNITPLGQLTPNVCFYRQGTQSD